MKILLVNDYGVLAGGAERVTLDLRDGLRARGHEVRLLTSTARPFALPLLADDRCVGTNGPGRQVLQVANPWAVRRLRQVLAAFRPDVVHVRMFLTQLSPRILPLLDGSPALLHVGNHQTICPVNTRVLPDGEPCTARAGVACYRSRCVSLLGLARTVVQLGAWRRHASVFRHVVANSHALADTLRANGVPVDHVIPNGTTIVDARPPLAWPPTIGFAGRLVAQKGVEVLVHATALVARRQPDVRLLIFGEGPERRRIEHLVAARGLGRVVRLCGHVNHADLAERLGSAWVQAVPSRSAEPGANVVTEAMMRGTAVVASRFDGRPEALQDGVTGFLVPPSEPEPLAARLLQLLDDPALAERMGAAGRAVALADFTSARMLDRFEALYASLVVTRAASAPDPARRR